MSGYPYVCVECGTKELHNRRFFGLKELLRRFVLTIDGERLSAYEYLSAHLHGVELGALFGGPVMDTPVATLSRAEAEDTARMTTIRLSVRGLLHMFEQQLNLERDALFLLAKSSDGACMSYLNDLQHEAENNNLSADELRQLRSYQTFERRMTPLLNSALGNEDTRQNECAAVIDALYVLLEAENNSDDDDDGMDIIASLNEQYVYAAWVYRQQPVSGVQEPFGLVFLDPETHEPRSCTRGCCPHCHRPIPRYFGSYQQVTVGVLGGQSTGKTTYLAAFSDYIDTDPSMSEVPFTIGYEAELDPQWQRFTRAPQKTGEGDAAAEDTAVAGPRWYYQNGYRIRKTELNRTAAASLSFLVSSRSNPESQPVIYVLADVAGEAFTGTRDQAAAQVAETQNRLLSNCDALFMVFSCAPEDTAIVAARYNEWMRGFSRAGVPAALLLTKADRLFAGSNEPAENKGLAAALQLKTKTKPVVNGCYNVEAMTALCNLGKECANHLSAGLINNLWEMLLQANGGDEDQVSLGVFPVCSGTAQYIEITTVTNQESEQEAARDRYTIARKERSGLSAPFLWLMSLQGLLPAGRGHSDLLQYKPSVAETLQRQLDYDMRHPIRM